MRFVFMDTNLIYDVCLVYGRSRQTPRRFPTKVIFCFMKSVLSSLLILLFVTGYAQKASLNKKAVIQSIDNHKQEMTNISDKIWAAAETAFNESQSSKLLADYAEANGFKVERGVAEVPTATPRSTLKPLASA